MNGVFLENLCRGLRRFHCVCVTAECGYMILSEGVLFEMMPPRGIHNKGEIIWAR